MALDANDLKQIGELAAKAVAEGTKKLGEELAAVSGTVKALTEGDNSVDKRIAAAVAEAEKKAAPTPDPKDKSADKGGDKDADNPVLAKLGEIGEQLKSVTEWKSKVEQEQAAATKAEATRGTIRAVLAAKYPKAASEAQRRQLERAEKFIALKSPADKAAAEAALKEWETDYAAPEALKSLTADPKAEGAKDGAAAKDDIERRKEQIDKAPIGGKL